MAATYEQKNKILEFYDTKKLEPLPHLHKELELIYVVKGGAKAVANSNVYDLHPGDLFLAFPYQVHCYLDALPGEYLVICFSASILPTLEGTVDNNELVNNVFHTEPESPETGFLMQMRYASGRYHVAERCAYTTLVVSKLLLKSTLNPLKQTSSQTTKTILEYCSKHYMENLSLDTLAKQLHLSKYYISHSINKQINMRLSTFINSLRVNAACRLLQDTDKKIADVAQSVGYETIRSFNRAFNEILGMTPKEYRARQIESTKKGPSQN